MKLPDLILHNFRLKVFSFVMAVLVWITMHLATQREKEPSSQADSAQAGQVER